MQRYIYPILIFIFTSGISALFGQLPPNYTIYQEQWGVINPAFISKNFIENNLSFSIAATNRDQWLGLNKFATNKENITPETQVINFEAIIGSEGFPNPIRLGGHLVRDKTGKLGQNGAFLHFAYVINLGSSYSLSRSIISIGLAGGLMQYWSELDGSELNIFDPEIGPSKAIAPDFNLGIYLQHSFRNEQVLYAGLSVPQLFSNEFRYTNSELDRNFSFAPRYYALIGGYLPFTYFGGGDNSLLEPSVWIKYTPNYDSFQSDTHVDFNLRYQHGQYFWGGIGGSSTGMMHFELGFFANKALKMADNKQVKLGLGSDLPMFSRFNRFQAFGPTLEVNLSYSWRND